MKGRETLPADVRGAWIVQHPSPNCVGPENKADTSFLKYKEALAWEATEDLVRTLVYPFASFGGKRGVHQSRGAAPADLGASLRSTLSVQLSWEPGGRVEG